MRPIPELFLDFASKRSGLYSYQNYNNCACAQFTQSLGPEMANRYQWWLLGNREGHETFIKLEELAGCEPHTWEALTQRIRRDEMNKNLSIFA